MRTALLVLLALVALAAATREARRWRQVAVAPDSPEAVVWRTGRARGTPYDRVEIVRRLAPYVELRACRGRQAVPGARYDDGCDEWLAGEAGGARAGTLVGPGDRAGFQRALSDLGTRAAEPALFARLFLGMRPEMGSEDATDPRDPSPECPVDGVGAYGVAGVRARLVARSPPSAFALVFDVAWDGRDLFVRRWSCRR